MSDLLLMTILYCQNEVKVGMLQLCQKGALTFQQHVMIKSQLCYNSQLKTLIIRHVYVSRYDSAIQCVPEICHSYVVNVSAETSTLYHICANRIQASEICHLNNIKVLTKMVKHVIYLCHDGPNKYLSEVCH